MKLGRWFTGSRLRSIFRTASRSGGPTSYGTEIVHDVASIGAVSTPDRRSEPEETEVDNLAQLESRLKNYPVFLDSLIAGVVDWENATRHSVESLQQWGITFGAVLRPALSSSEPFPPAYQAFVSLLSSLLGFCRTLEEDLKTNFYPLLRKLKTMTEHPQRLLDKMRSLESPRFPLSRFQRSENRLLYCLLRSTLLSQLPVFHHAMHRAIELAVRILTQKQIAFLTASREKWINLFSSLREEGERYGGTEETLRAWQMRWEVVQRKLTIWENQYILGESLTEQEVGPATSSQMTLPTQLSVTSSSAELQVLSDVHPSFLSCIPPKFQIPFADVSSIPSSPSTRSSVTRATSILYIIRALRSYNPPHDPYRGYAFFTLVHGASFEVLQEYDHSSIHFDLPLCFVNEDEDSLLMVRARNRGPGYEAGDVGWVPARFVCPTD